MLFKSCNQDEHAATEQETGRLPALSVAHAHLSGGLQALRAVKRKPGYGGHLLSWRKSLIGGVQFPFLDVYFRDVALR